MNLTELEESLAIIFGSITAFSGILSILSKTFRDILLSPFRAKKERIVVHSSKIDLDRNNLDFVKQLQDFQSEELDKLLQKLKEQASEFEGKIHQKTREFESIIKEKDRIIQKQWRVILRHEAKMEAHGIVFEKFEE